MVQCGFGERGGMWEAGRREGRRGREGERVSRGRYGWGRGGEVRGGGREGRRGCVCVCLGWGACRGGRLGRGGGRTGGEEGREGESGGVVGMEVWGPRLCGFILHVWLAMRN